LSSASKRTTMVCCPSSWDLCTASSVATELHEVSTRGCLHSKSSGQMLAHAQVHSQHTGGRRQDEHNSGRQSTLLTWNDAFRQVCMQEDTASALRLATEYNDNKLHCKAISTHLASSGSAHMCTSGPRSAVNIWHRSTDELKWQQRHEHSMQGEHPILRNTYLQLACVQQPMGAAEADCCAQVQDMTCSWECKRVISRPESHKNLI
jgi:hypothetical protein